MLSRISSLTARLLILGLAAGALHSILQGQIKLQYSTTLTLSEPSADRAQLFWRAASDESFVEARSLNFNLKTGSNAIIADLPIDTISARLDPIIGPGRVEIEPICFSILRLSIQCVSAPGTITSLGADPQLTWAIPQKVRIALPMAFWTCVAIGAAAVTALVTRLMKPSPLRAPSIAATVVAGTLCLLGGAAVWSWLRPGTEAKLNAFTHGRAPVFVEHLFDQKGFPLSDRPGNFAVMMDPYTLFRSFPLQNVFGVTTDRSGFRGSDGIAAARSIRKAPLGILLGGSAAFGWRLESDSQTLDAALKKETGIHFINMATVSHLVGQELATFVHYGFDYNPDIVVGFSGWNDFYENYLDVERSGFGFNSAFQDYQDRLRLFYLSETPRNLKKALPYGPTHFKRVSPEKLAEHYVANARKIAQTVSAGGGKYFLLLQPDLHFKKHITENESLGLKNWSLFKDRGDNFKSLYRRYTERVDVLCRQEGIQVMNLARQPEFQDSREDLFNDTVHLTAEGNKTVARLFAKKFDFSQPENSPQRLLPRTIGPRSPRAL